MKTFDEKLKKMVFENPGVTRWIKLNDKEINQLKALFEAEMLDIKEELCKECRKKVDEKMSKMSAK